MNCLWLLILLFCSGNRSGWNFGQNGNCCERERENSCDCDRRNDRTFDRRRDNDCDCDRRRDSDCDSDRRRENDCDCERRTFIPFGSQTCGCDGNQNQS